MRSSPDVIVIGAGVIGLATAFELLRAGLKVTVLERGTVGRGSASWAGGGILAPLDPAEMRPPTAALLRQALERYPRWCDELRAASGVDPEWEASGLLVLDSRDADLWRRWADAQAFGSVSAIPLRDLPSLCTREEALLIPGVAQVRNPRLLRALAATVRALGGVIREQTPVREVLVESGCAAGVSLDGAALRSGAVVLAAGAWSGDLSREVRIEPVRGQMLLFRGEPGALGHIVLRDGRYLIPRRDGRILAGSTLENVGFDERTTEEGREAILSAAIGMMPALARMPIEAHWAGLRPAPAAEEPRIGESDSVRGLVFNCGHHRLGITLAPASAQRVCALLRPGARA